MKIYKVVPFKLNRAYHCAHWNITGPCYFCAIHNQKMCITRTVCMHFERKFKLEELSLLFIEK